MMRDNAILVDTSNDGTIRHATPTKALTEGNPYGYASDVHEGEPPRHSTLLELPNVLATLHAGFATYGANYRMGIAAADSIIAFKDGATSPNVVTSLAQLYM